MFPALFLPRHKTGPKWGTEWPRNGKCGNVRVNWMDSSGIVNVFAIDKPQMGSRKEEDNRQQSDAQRMGRTLKEDESFVGERDKSAATHNWKLKEILRQYEY